jgi:hypothetical protein
LSWNAVAGASSYNVYRGTSPGGEGATPLATGVTGRSFVDNHATPGTTYYYQVSAVNLGGEGPRSSEQAAPAQFTTILAIDAGGGAVGSFVADTDYVGNTLTYVTSATIDTSGVYQAPPQAVYQSMRYANPPGFGYSIVGLTPGTMYTVRLHFVEPTLWGVGQRVFNVTLNGAAFLTNFDIYVAAGNAGNKAVAEVGTATADANGQISIGFSNVINDPLVCGIEILSSTSSSHAATLVQAAVGSQHTTTPSYSGAALTWGQFFTVDEGSHSAPGKGKSNPSGFLVSSEWKLQLLSHTLGHDALSGTVPEATNHAWVQETLTASGDGAPDDSKRDPLHAPDQGSAGPDWIA